MSLLIRWEPFRDICTLQDRMNRLFGEVSHRPGATDQGLTAGPQN